MNKNNLKKLYTISNSLDVLYVEDDKLLQSKVQLILKDLFHTVDCSDDGSLGLEQYNKYYEEYASYYDLVITDIQMPKINGIDLSKAIRKINKDQTIIVISAHDDSDYLIEFIDIGINKFIKKPFDFGNLIESLLNILESKNNDKIYLDTELFWDTRDLKLYKKDELIPLSNSELQLLKLFINNPSQVFSKYDIFNILEEDNFDAVSSDDSVKSIIKRLRKKIPADMIQNIYGKGYKFNIL